MCKQRLIHAELLIRQLSEVFKAVNDRQIHRTRFNDFKGMFLENRKIVEYSHNLIHDNKAKSWTDIQVKTEGRDWWFRQWYNYGVMQCMDVLVQDNTGKCFTLGEILDDEATDLAYRHEVLIDFEYAISVATESVATNLANLG